jgi:hypothetical protein
VFACTQIGSVYYLREDMSVQCYTPSHMRYYRAGVWWLIFYCFGIPVFFLGMLFSYGIPQAARRLRSASAVRALVDLAWQRRIPQPDVNTSTLDAQNISAEHVDALYRGVFHARAPARASASSQHGTGGAGWLTPRASAAELPDAAARLSTPSRRSDTLVAQALAAAALSREAEAAAEAAAAAAEVEALQSHPPVSSPPPPPTSLLRRVTRRAHTPLPVEVAMTREQKLKRLLAWSKSRVRGAHLSWHDVPHEAYAHATGISDLYHHFYIDKWCAAR